MVRVGIVAEGPTDILVLEAVMRTLASEIEFVHIQPEPTILSRHGNGWRGVKSWCEEYGPKLESYMAEVRSRPLDILVIHADCSMADKTGVERPCPPASDTALALGKLVEVDWLGRDPKPEFVVIATPSMSSDAWVAAAFEEPYANLGSIECDKTIEDEFVRRKLFRKKPRLRMIKGRMMKVVEIKKPPGIYRSMAARCESLIDSVCECCSQAEAFRSNFRAAVARSLP